MNSEVQSLLDQSQAFMLIAVSVVTLATLVFALSLGVVIHHIMSDRQRRRNRQRFDDAAIVLSPHLVVNDPRLEQVVDATRESAGDRAVGLVLRRARFDLAGPIVERITKILEDMGEVDKLLTELKSRRDWRRAGAIRGLGECGGERAREVLITASEDQSGEVRRAARDGLLADGSPEAIHAAIHSFLIDLPRRAGWRRTFYARLAATASPQLTELIRTGKLGPSEEKLAIEALGDAARPESLALAVERINSADAEMRATAMRVIGKVATAREVPLVLAGLDDQEWFVRAAAARAVEWMSTLNTASSQNGWKATACDRLVRHLADPSWWVRANAARALSRSGNIGINALLAATGATDRYAREAAIAALAMAPLTRDVRVAVKERIETVVAAAEKKAQQQQQQPQPERKKDLFA
jgi:HEAT repeat protein